MVHRWVRRFELFIGFGPFNVVYPVDSDLPTLKLSRTGLLISLLQILSYLASHVIVLVLGPSALWANENDLAELSFKALSFMSFLNAVVIFSLVMFNSLMNYNLHKCHNKKKHFPQVFIRRKTKLRIAPLDRCIDAHMQELPIEWTSFHRKLSGYLWMSLVATLLIAGSAFGVELYICSVSTPPEFQYLVPFYAIASITPFLYAEVVTIQFCLNVVVIQFFTDQTNGVLQRLCDNEGMQYN